MLRILTFQKGNSLIGVLLDEDGNCVQQMELVLREDLMKKPISREEITSHVDFIEWEISR